MKINWKILSLATIFSIIITGIIGLILTITETIQAYPVVSDSILQDPYGNKIATTTVKTGNGAPYYFHLWEIIGLGLICIFIITIMIYFVTLFVNKKSGKNIL